MGLTISLLREGMSTIGSMADTMAMGLRTGPGVVGTTVSIGKVIGMGMEFKCSILGILMLESG